MSGPVLKPWKPWTPPAIPVEPINLRRVRCLGPGPEHYFDSEDRRKNRVCDACRVKMRNVSPLTKIPAASG